MYTVALLEPSTGDAAWCEVSAPALIEGDGAMVFNAEPASPGAMALDDFDDDFVDPLTDDDD